MTFLDQWGRARGETGVGFNLLLVVAGAMLMTLSAKFQVPLYPVPLSMQTLVAIGLGFALGPVLGATAVLAFLLQGAAGLPVFAGTPQNGIGLAYMMGPTGGYLLGFVLAAFVAGTLVRAGLAKSMVGTLAIALAAGASVYLPGLLWLSGFVGAGAGLLEAGLYPFIPGDIVKAAIAALAFPAIGRALARIADR